MRLKVKLILAAVAVTAGLIGSTVPAHAALLEQCVPTMTGGNTVCIDGTGMLHDFVGG